MVEKQPIIYNLQNKSNEAKEKARWWDVVSFAGFLGWVGIEFSGKPSPGKSLAGWVAVIGSLFATMWASSWKSRGDALQESVNEIRNAPESYTDQQQTGWQQKIVAQDVAPTVIGR